MTLATLKDVLPTANAAGSAVAGLVVLGWEEARAFVAAAEALGTPVILQAGPGARRHMPVEVFGAMFRSLGETASVPVVAHLDHGEDAQTCERAIRAGFTSVMFDGSRLALEENIRITASIARTAHDAGVSIEGEIGFVGYDNGETSAGTDPEEAATFARETGVDAMAVSVGNVHLQPEARASIDRGLIDRISARTDTPLVLHGTSGIPHDMRRRLAAETQVAKFNIGTELRQAFGAALRRSLSEQPGIFDRIALLQPTEAAVEVAARRAIASVTPELIL